MRCPSVPGVEFNGGSVGTRLPSALTEAEMTLVRLTSGLLLEAVSVIVALTGGGRWCRLRSLGRRGRWATRPCRPRRRPGARVAQRGISSV